MVATRLRFPLSLLILLLALVVVTTSINVQAQTEPTATPEAPSLLVAPKSGVPGSIHLIFAKNLPPNTRYHLEIRYTVTDAPAVSLDVTSANNGSITYNFVSSADTPPGEYAITLYEGTQLVLEGSLTVEGEIPPTIAATETPAATPTITPTPIPPVGMLRVNPQGGPVGTTHIISGSGLNANYSYLLDIVYGGSVVFGATVTTSETGDLSYSIFTEPGDPAGVYQLRLYDGETLVRAGTFTLLGDTAPATEVQPMTPTFTPTTTPEAPATLEPTVTPAARTNDDDLQPGVVVTGELSGSTAENEYTFTGTADSVIILKMQSADFDSYLLLLDPAGDVVMRNDNGGGDFNAEISGFTLPVDGTYTVIATSRPNLEKNGRPESSGTYTLLLSYARQANSGAIVSGETVIGELAAGDARPIYTFEGQAGERVTIDLASDDFDPYVTLVSPDGRQIMADDDSGPGLYARIQRFELRTSGEYSIIVDGFRGPTGRREIEGAYRLSLVIDGDDVTVFQPTVEATETPGAQPTAPVVVPDGADQIAYGETIEGELGDDVQTASYAFQGSSGTVVTIALNSDAFDPLLILLDSAGNQVAVDDDSGPGVYALLENFTLPADDTYTIVVDGYRGVNGERQLAGSYTLSLASDDVVAVPTHDNATTQAPTPLPPIENNTTTGEIEPGESVSGSLQGEVQSAAYRFSARAGEIATIDLTSDHFDPYLRLLDREGNILAEDDDSGGNSQARIADFVIPANGDYIIVVDTFRGFSETLEVTGDYVLTLEIEAGAAQPTATLEPQNRETATPIQPRLELGSATPTPAAPVLVRPSLTALPPVDDNATRTLPALPIDPFAVEGIPLNVGEVTDGTLTGAPDEALVFTVDAQAGDTVALYVLYNDVEIDTILRVFAPDGTEIAVDDDSGRTFNPEILPLVLPQDGEYRLVVQPYINGAAGDVEVYYLPYTAYIISETPQQAFVTDKYQQMPLVFEGNAGEEVQLVIQRLSYDSGVPTITVRQNGVVLAQTSVAVGSRITIAIPIPADGPVNVELSYTGVGGALLELRLAE